MAPPKPFGPFFDKGHMNVLQSRVAASLVEGAPEVKAALKAATPVGEPRKTRPGGELQKSLKTRVTKSKRGVAIVARADAKNEQGEHYGVFVEARDSFLANALADVAVTHIEDAIVAFANEMNEGATPLRAPAPRATAGA